MILMTLFLGVSVVSASLAFFYLYRYVPRLDIICINLLSFKPETDPPRQPLKQQPFLQLWAVSIFVRHCIG
jgi:hypothetical protein